MCNYIKDVEQKGKDDGPISMTKTKSKEEEETAHDDPKKVLFMVIVLEGNA